jgi:hypothetical protein
MLMMALIGVRYYTGGITKYVESENELPLLVHEKGGYFVKVSSFLIKLYLIDFNNLSRDVVLFDHFTCKTYVASWSH